MSKTSGSCLCKGVSFLVNGDLRPVSYCYCSQCRKTHGVMGPYTRAVLKDIEFTSDRTLKWFQSSDKAERGFCDTCGSSIFWRVIGADSSAISAGTIDQPSGLLQGGHIYTNDVPDFYPLPDDGLPRFSGTSAGDLNGEQST